MTTFARTFALLPVNGWLSEAEASALWEAAQNTHGAILEVGCYHGRSTCLLARLGRPVLSVDPFANFDSDDPSGDRIEARWRTNTAGFSNVTLYRQRIEEWTPQPVGLAHLDGDHTYEGTRRQVAMAIVCGASIITVHDVNDRGEGMAVRDAAVRLLGPWQQRVERLAIWEVAK